MALFLYSPTILLWDLQWDGFLMSSVLFALDGILVQILIAAFSDVVCCFLSIFSWLDAVHVPLRLVHCMNLKISHGIYFSRMKECCTMVFCAKFPNAGTGASCAADLLKKMNPNLGHDLGLTRIPIYQR